MDEKRWDEWGEVFTEDAEIDTTEDAPQARFAGRANIVAFVSGAVGPAVTIHHGHMPEIEILGPGRARGIWAMEDHLEFPGDPPAFIVDGRGHYHEEYEKGVDGQLADQAPTARAALALSRGPSRDPAAGMTRGASRSRKRRSTDVGRAMGRAAFTRASAPSTSVARPRRSTARIAKVGARPTPESQWITTPPGVAAISSSRASTAASSGGMAPSSTGRLR